MHRRGGDNKAGDILGESTSCLLSFDRDMLESSLAKGSPDAYGAKDYRGLRNSATMLGESSLCLLSFQNDIIEALDTDKNVSEKSDKLRPTSTSRMREGRTKMTRHVARSKSADGVRIDDLVQENVARPSSAIKSRVEASLLTPPCKNYNDNIDTLPIATRTNEFSRPPPPQRPGRSRPGIRTHRSGSFALRQFKENYNQQQIQRPKTKAEARSNARTHEENTTTPSITTMSENSAGWTKPALRQCRSEDSSFRRHCVAKPRTTEETNDVMFHRPTGVVSRTMEFDGTLKFKRTMVEVAPGYSMLMCGIDETMHALHLDRIVHVECSCCSTFLACINVASMVLCPGCQSVNPLESASHLYEGVPVMGLGLRVEDILAQTTRM